MAEGRLTLDRKKFQAMEFLVRQQAARTYLEECLDISTGTTPLSSVLSDGTLLCKLMRKIDPSYISTFVESPKHGAQKRDNVQLFNEAAKKHLQMEPYLIIPSDVVEEVFPVKLVDLILVLAKKIGDISPNSISVKLDMPRARQDLMVTPENLSEAEAMLEKEPCVPMEQLGFNHSELYSENVEEASSDNSEKDVMKRHTTEEEKIKKTETDEKDSKTSEERNKKLNYIVLLLIITFLLIMFN
ncbi:putative Calponin homology (CH) domain [Monocercomonoides exilis]|uniref:putative Calponin homology (CH) domain n=1 Tax=Monocercomonoides exilis TaxID=2049356 RepID=UPI003559834A|nr:putative Calponin homology (CH) domain [Monocercomonoides exilis]|eukprot:MONOS_2906.1-p1 / transcript=MONOS_2906.1 / gene=MONOS_2906 / organism=Monocercomonoides_exilis_PA203 / gene_product=unspecified product / transcript_product=unspecified product / location=Mono_scaffold00063:127981-128935(-) / protein_length=242 / sequence_SO=supercontig / SO=protein_coding / is_pseudo=false